MAHLAIHQSSSKQIFARSEKTPLYAGILTYEYQQSVGKIPRGEPICGCDVDGYRPDTLEGGIEFVAASMFRKVSMRLGKLRFMVEIHLLSRLLLRNAGSCLPKG